MGSQLSPLHGLGCGAQSGHRKAWPPGQVHGSRKCRFGLSTICGFPSSCFWPLCKLPATGQWFLVEKDLMTNLCCHFMFKKHFLFYLLLWPTKWKVTSSKGLRQSGKTLIWMQAVWDLKIPALCIFRWGTPTFPPPHLLAQQAYLGSYLSALQVPCFSFLTPCSNHPHSTKGSSVQSPLLVPPDSRGLTGTAPRLQS